MTSATISPSKLSVKSSDDANGTIHTHAVSDMQKVCEVSDLAENSGVCALIENVQVAIFKLSDGSDASRVYALSNWDPIGKANVMYRGILGSILDEPVICSPLYKQHYSLLTGACFENDDVQLSVYSCVVQGSSVFVARVAQNSVAA